MSDPRAETLIHGCRGLLGREPEPLQLQQLLDYLDLLEHWNQAYNLTAVREPAEMVSRHLLDSLTVLPHVGAGPLLDAGTGAGLPGVPLAIMSPALQVTLLDSAGKKIRFLRQVKRQLELTRIHPVQARLESFSATDYVPDGHYAAIVSRAFASLAEFAESSRHLMGADTRLLAMKGRLPGSELDLLPNWIQVNAVEKLSAPGLQPERHLVIMSLTA